MHFLSRLKGYKTDENGTWLKIFIGGVDLEEKIKNKEVKNLEVRFDDGRSISNDQRKKIYATIRDICEYTGYLPEEQKELMKYLHIAKTGCDYFSLSKCSMDTAREFINTILDFCIENGVQLKESGINRTSDIDHYLWKCLKERKCCICGSYADLHHVEAVGMGRDRNKVDDSNFLKMALCRIHHTESHSIGQDEFCKKYKVYGIKYIDEG